MIFEIIILLIAGFGAGIVTGLFGASAVMFAASLLILVLDYDPYLAIGLALGIDVFASLTATFVYKKHKNIDLKKAFPFLISSLIGVLIGSYFSIFMPSQNLAIIEGIGIFVVGLGIFFKKKKQRRISKKPFNKMTKFLLLILFGLLVGLIAGFFGAGGGLMIFLSLIFVLGYGLHKAIGTSVLLMIFIAFFGSVTHYYYMPFSFNMIFFGAIGGIIGAKFSADIANKLNEKTLNKLVGIILMIIGISLFLKGVIL
jgi:uncharacterized membrane protein YfcA